ncbi:alanine--tRNA ligase [Beggiatoa leptomitoformis]|uniref:Alanine--tRNA ligase n=1 Tax=Beggiatoa leptomitoformis TaxID=288004 RepID=A0A2N9YGN7_9GAMM|nr:alanine--tRNA ligase [Beggiatoa leptomitoformis]AUI69670.2 alanine--tRNA ligase [Beggiatoa leptomitoformis]
MSVIELRQQFLNYFASKGHTIVSSSPLVPGNDPTLLFTNAGMVQFKDTFLGLEKRDYKRAVTCQRCVRAGGKHNDLENVGYTARHHTFFEMLGNFSFGDYFKREAIQFAWEFLTKELGLPPEKLWVTVYEEDREAEDIWLKEMKVDPTRFSRCGKHSNFWMMGDTGPCGPCSEIFYDHGEGIFGGPPGSPDEDGDRYIEIWNLVFMQFNRDTSGALTPLPHPSVDTGMGLERLAAVLQHVHSNYEIDLFQSLLKAVGTVANRVDYENSSLRVIADHIRACAFLIVDGVIPSNEGRGYVLRRIIRRAVRHGYKLGLHEPFFYRLVPALDTEMGAAYPELRKATDLVGRLLKQEEERFAETLSHGMVLLNEAMQHLNGKTIIAGDVVFKLYDTYGFPTDLTADVAREHELSIDMEGFERCMTEQRTRAREAGHFKVDLSNVALTADCQSVFIGYNSVAGDSTITALFFEGHEVEQLSAGQTGQIILDSTPFYAESGGQVGDKGQLNNATALFIVTDTQKIGHANAHIGTLKTGIVHKGDKLHAQIDVTARQSTARNHSATHLLHAALRQVLGEHVKQKGSSVDTDRLRFDFAHFEPITAKQLATIEHIVNEKILNNTSVQTQVMNLDDAVKSGAMALFGEKYEDDVRVLSMADNFSVELCGGTHVQRVGDIGLFKILSESGVAAGVRRIEAITGTQTLAWVTETENHLNHVLSTLKTGRDSLETRLQQLLEQVRQGEKELSRLQSKLASSQGDDLAGQATEINGVHVLAHRLDNVDVKQLRDTLDQLKNKLASAVIVLASVKDDKVSLVAGVTADVMNKVKAGELVNHVAQQVGGKGGGRPDMAQAGGSDPSHLPAALNSVVGWVQERL